MTAYPEGDYGCLTHAPTTEVEVSIKILMDSSYVDSGESTNLVQSITNVGLARNGGLDQSMDSFSSGSLATELSGFDCFVVPELESGDFYSALSASDITDLASWVGEGH